MKAKGILIALFRTFSEKEHRGTAPGVIQRDDLMRPWPEFLATREMFDYLVEGMIAVNQVSPGTIRFETEEGLQFQRRCRRLGKHFLGYEPGLPDIFEFLESYPEPTTEEWGASYAHHSELKGKLERRYLSGNDFITRWEASPAGGFDLFFNDSYVNRLQEAGYVRLDPEWESFQPNENCLEILSDPDVWLI